MEEFKMNFVEDYLFDMEIIIGNLRRVYSGDIQNIIDIIINVAKNNGRIFFVGLGGSLSNSSHAVNDFRKIGNIECYNPAENLSELTATTNDVGFEYVFYNWLVTSKLNSNDLLFFLSVGGGDKERNISLPIIKAADLGKVKGSKIVAIVGREEGYVNKIANATIIIPPVNLERITPYSEGLQSVLLHLIVTHPDIKKAKTKWEEAQYF